MKAIVRKEVHLTIPMVKSLTKQAKTLKVSLKKHMEIVLENQSKVDENAKAS